MKAYSFTAEGTKSFKKKTDEVKISKKKTWEAYGIHLQWQL